MKRKFIAKLNKGDKELLIVTDGHKYGILNGLTGLDLLLTLRKKELYAIIASCDLNSSLAPSLQFLSVIESQYVFATGVTYKWTEDKLNSLAEGDIYKKLYLAKRPMFFFKGLKQTIAENDGNISLREDAQTNIPEGELIAVFNAFGEVIGFTLGNDQTALDFEKENPLYQLQAKFFHHSSSMHPLILISDELPLLSIKTEVTRKDKIIVDLIYSTENFNRDLDSIGKYLFELKIFSKGVFLFLGCGVSYPKEMALIEEDIVEISSEHFPIKLANRCKKL